MKPMLHFETLFPGIRRLWVPFEIDKTCVFALDSGDGRTVLADCATTEYDVRENILPALAELGLIPDGIFVSHDHGDHSGGLPFLMAAFPGAKLFTGCENLVEKYADRATLLRDGDCLSGRWTAVSLPGHTPDLTGLFDRETGTLLSFDGLQLYGVAKWGMGVGDMAAYLRTLDRLESEAFAENLVTSHIYADLGCIAAGRDPVLRYVRRCRECVEQVERFVRRSGLTDPEALAEQYRREVSLPPIGAWTFRALLDHMQSGGRADG